MGGFGNGVRGQTQAVTTVRRALLAHRVPHAYLFVGPPGVGKTLVARGLAKALNCDLAGDDFCDACRPCRLANAGNHPDVVTLRPAEGKTQVGVEGVRDALAALPYRPHEGRSRVVLVPDAHALTPEAQNALLKSLEEPPAGTHFVLATPAPHMLLATVRSRAERVRFAPLSTDDLEAILRERGVSAEAARMCASLAAGSVERGLALAADAGAVARRRDAARALDRAADAALAREALAVSEDLQDRDEARAVLETLLTVLRDVVLLAHASDPAAIEPRLLHRDLADELLLRARAMGGRRALGRLALVTDALEALARNANVQLTLDRMVLEMAEVRA